MKNDNIIIGSKIASAFRDYQKINEHVRKIDALLGEEYTTNGITEKFGKILSERGFTYKEHLALFDSSIKEDEFHLHGAFLFLQIETEYGYWSANERVHGRKDFTNLYEPTQKGYHELLSTFPHILEKFQDDKQKAIAPIKRMWEHIYINGASGSGKSTLMKHIIHALSKEENGIILIDPQGKLASEGTI